MAYVLEEDTEKTLNKLQEFIEQVHPPMDSYEEGVSVAIMHLTNMLIRKCGGLENTIAYIEECKQLNLKGK